LTYSVLLKDHKELSVQNDTQVFCDILGFNDYDARAHISRNSQGIIASGIEQARAEALKNALKAQGYSPIVVPDNLINSLDLKPVRIANFSESIFLEDIYGNGVHYSFDDISAIAVSMNKETERNTPFEREYILDIILVNGKVLRLNSKKFNYQYLEDRKSHSVMENFNSLLTDIEEKTPSSTLKENGYSFALAQQFEKIAAPENTRAWNQYILWLSHSHLLFSDEKEPLKEIEPPQLQEKEIPEIQVQETEAIIPQDKELDKKEEETDLEQAPEIQTLETSETSLPPLQETSSKELNKQIRAVNKALDNNREPEEIAAKMEAKGVPLTDAEAITQTLNSFRLIGEDEDKKVWILEQNKIPEEYHNNFLKIAEKFSNDDILEKVRNKQGISKEARRKGAIKAGRIAMLIISIIFFVSSFVYWKGSNNTIDKYTNMLNQRYGSHASAKMKAMPEYEKMQFQLKMMTIASVSFGIAFLLLCLYAGVNPYQSSRLGFLFFACLIGYELYPYRGAIIFNFSGHIIKVFGITSLFYAYNAAKRQKVDQASSKAV